MNAEEPQTRDARPQGDFVRGMLGLLLLHLLQLPMTWLSAGVSVFIIGVTQLLYVIPLLIVLIVKKQSDAAKGFCTAAGITFLLNTTCAAILFALVK